jgi:hypothetical protein
MKHVKKKIPPQKIKMMKRFLAVQEQLLERLSPPKQNLHRSFNNTGNLEEKLQKARRPRETQSGVHAIIGR